MSIFMSLFLTKTTKHPSIFVKSTDYFVGLMKPPNTCVLQHHSFHFLPYLAKIKTFNPLLIMRINIVYNIVQKSIQYYVQNFKCYHWIIRIKSCFSEKRKISLTEYASSSIIFLPDRLREMQHKFRCEYSNVLKGWFLQLPCLI